MQNGKIKTKVRLIRKSAIRRFRIQAALYNFWRIDACFNCKEIAMRRNHMGEKNVLHASAVLELDVVGDANARILAN